MSLQRGDANPVLRQKLPWNASSAKVSPDARKLIYSVAEGATSTVYMSGLDGSAPRRLFGIDDHIEQLNWSPDGGRIAVIVQPSKHEQLEPSLLFVTSTFESSPRRLLDKFDSVYCSAWSRDGKELFVAATSAGTNSVWRVKLSDNSLTLISHGSARELEASSDGRFLYLQRGAFDLRRLPLGGGDVEHAITGVLRFAVGENEVYFERQDSKPPVAKGLNLYRTDLAMQVPQFVANIGFLPASMQLSSDGKLMYLVRHESTGEHIMLVRGWRPK